MIVYVVNELCEFNETYNNCIGVFTSLEEARDMALRKFKTALNDLGGETYCTINKDKDNFQVYNDNESIEIHIDRLDLQGLNTNEYIASINWMVEDIEIALEEEGYKTSSCNVNTILNHGRFIKTLREQSIERGFEVISETIKSNSEVLEKVEEED